MTCLFFFFHVRRTFWSASQWSASAIHFHFAWILLAVWAFVLLQIQKPSCSLPLFTDLLKTELLLIILWALLYSISLSRLTGWDLWRHGISTSGFVKKWEAAMNLYCFGNAEHALSIPSKDFILCNFFSGDTSLSCTEDSLPSLSKKVNTITGSFY